MTRLCIPSYVKKWRTMIGRFSRWKQQCTPTLSGTLLRFVKATNFEEALVDWVVGSFLGEGIESAHQVGTVSQDSRDIAREGPRERSYTELILRGGWVVQVRQWLWRVQLWRVEWNNAKWQLHLQKIAPAWLSDRWWDESQEGIDLKVVLGNQFRHKHNHTVSVCEDR